MTVVPSWERHSITRLTGHASAARSAKFVELYSCLGDRQMHFVH